MSGNTDVANEILLSDPIDNASQYGPATGFIVVRLNKAVLKSTIQDNDDPLFPIIGDFKTSFADNPVWCILQKQTRYRNFAVVDDQVVKGNSKIVCYTVMRANDSPRDPISKSITVSSNDLEINLMYFFPAGDEGLQSAIECYQRVLLYQKQHSSGVEDDKRLRMSVNDTLMEPPAQATPPLGEVTPPMLQMFKRSISDDNISSLRTSCSSVEPVCSPRPSRPQTVPPELYGPRCSF